MPILPENKHRYPKNWKEIRQKILEECENKCEFCGVENRTLRNNKIICLTIAHLDHTPENCERENLKALCQKCHNQHDAAHRAETRRLRKQTIKPIKIPSLLRYPRGCSPNETWNEWRLCV